MPTLSIILVSYKRFQFLSECLQSILKQEFNDFECIIVNDNVTDVDFSKKVSLLVNSDARFLIFNRPPNYKKGLSGCRNAALDVSRGQYVHFVDDDDLIHSEHFIRKINALRNNSDYSFIVSKLKTFTITKDLQNCQLTNELSNIDDAYKAHILGRIKFFSCAVLWKSEVLKEFRFDDTLLYSEEWDLYRKILEKYDQGGLLNDELYFRRIHSGSNTSRFHNRNLEETSAYIKTRTRAFRALIESPKWDDDYEEYFWKFASKWRIKELKQVIIRQTSSPLKRIKRIISWFLG